MLLRSGGVLFIANIYVEFIDRDMKLWRRISSTNTALSDLLPPQRTRQLRSRSHNYILPTVQINRFKSVFINRRLFNSN